MIDGGVSIGLDLVRQFEGFRASPYPCPAGKPTIGYGSTTYADGTPVALTDPPISQANAEALARGHLERMVPQILKLCPGIDTPGRLGAVMDFAYNLGLGAIAGSTLRRRINAGRWEDVPGELMRWRYAGGKELPGLIKRRVAEAALI